MPRYQATLWYYTENQPADEHVVAKMPLEQPGEDPADRVFGVLVSLRETVEAARAAGDMPDADLPHVLHPPDLRPEHERGYRLLSRWENDLQTDERVDDAWLDRTRETEKSSEYDQHFTVEVVTLHVAVGPFTLRLTPDGIDEVVADGNRLWAGDVFGPPSVASFRGQLERLDDALAECERVATNSRP